MSYKTNRPQKQLSYKSIRPEMLLSIKNECLLVREVYQNHLSKKVVLVSKNWSDKMSITGDLRGLRHNKIARWQVFVAKSNETRRSKDMKMSTEEPMSELNDGQAKIPKKRHKKSLENQGIKFLMAGVKGLEPSTFCVTGRRSNQTELHPHSR